LGHDIPSPRHWGVAATCFDWSDAVKLKPSNTDATLVVTTLFGILVFGIALLIVLIEARPMSITARVTVFAVSAAMVTVFYFGLSTLRRWEERRDEEAEKPAISVNKFLAALHEIRWHINNRNNW
jgi:O-antigen/teichoic acid export membrane protein